MAQVTIYMNNNLETQIKSMATSLDISISKFISNILEQKIHNEWNNSVKQLSGSWNDFSSINDIRQDNIDDIKREEF